MAPLEKLNGLSIKALGKYLMVRDLTSTEIKHQRRYLVLNWVDAGEVAGSGDENDRLAAAGHAEEESVTISEGTRELLLLRVEDVKSVLGSRRYG